MKFLEAIFQRFVLLLALRTSAQRRNYFGISGAKQFGDKLWNWIAISFLGFKNSRYIAV